MNHRKPKNTLRDYGRYSSIAFQMLVIIGVGIFGGFKLDEYLKLKFPVFVLIFSFLSVALAIYYVVKDLIRKK
ncbi:MAG TPA: AtpZ/AtpI family protein [Bacteroidales bacterium]|nr:AtpZ/AtpI family protein [Bacteroidales bacterium]HPS16664.1 AtpZ/AtpI family protein [Bacteroidales bacterium]